MLLKIIKLFTKLKWMECKVQNDNYEKIEMGIIYKE
jgi:hypothetical protein